MRYAFKQIVINPHQPVRQAGHIQQVDPVEEVHDDLHARILALDDNDKIFINVSCDLLGINVTFTRELKALVKHCFDKPFELVVSCTHTHYAGDTKDTNYYNQLLDQISESIQLLEFKEVGEITTSFTAVTPFEEVGKSRISHHDAITVLGDIKIYGDGEYLGSILYHNVHPTVLSASETHFFSAEWPGYALNRLSEEHEGKFFTYLQGASGDISTRFTRSSQDYEGVKELGEKFVAKVDELNQQEHERFPLNLAWHSITLQQSHEFNEINFDEIPDYATARELETISYGKIVRERLKEHPENLTKEVTLSRVSLGSVTLVFSPNELFSGYIAYLDPTKALLVCYSNGYSPYVTPIDKKLLTYETFTDTLTRECKENLIKVLTEYGN